MSELKEEKIRDLSSIHLHDATEQELEHLKKMTDDDLLRASSSLDLCAVVESMRRLKNALNGEERAIKWLTGVLVFLTVALVILGVVPLWR